MAGNNILICQCDAFIRENMRGAAEMITCTSQMELAAEEGVLKCGEYQRDGPPAARLDRMLNAADLLQGTVLVSRM